MGRDVLEATDDPLHYLSVGSSGHMLRYPKYLWPVQHKSQRSKANILIMAEVLDYAKYKTNPYMGIRVHHRTKLPWRFSLCYEAQAWKLMILRLSYRDQGSINRRTTWRELCFASACVWSNVTNSCRFSALSTDNLLAKPCCIYQITHERMYDYNTFEKNHMHRLIPLIFKQFQNYLQSCTEFSSFYVPIRDFTSSSQSTLCFLELTFDAMPASGDPGWATSLIAERMTSVAWYAMMLFWERTHWNEEIRQYYQLCLNK